MLEFYEDDEWVKSHQEKGSLREEANHFFTKQAFTKHLKSLSQGHYHAFMLQ